MPAVKADELKVERAAVNYLLCMFGYPKIEIKEPNWTKRVSNSIMKTPKGKDKGKGGKGKGKC